MATWRVLILQGLRTPDSTDAVLCLADAAEVLPRGRFVAGSPGSPAAA